MCSHVALFTKTGSSVGLAYRLYFMDPCLRNLRSPAMIFLAGFTTVCKQHSHFPGTLQVILYLLVDQMAELLLLQTELGRFLSLVLGLTQVDRCWNHLWKASEYHIEIWYFGASKIQRILLIWMRRGGHLPYQKESHLNNWWNCI